MLVRLQIGSRTGEVIDFLPHEARAMIADGRAVLPDAPSVTLAQVTAREDRGMLRTKRTAHR